jgi:hypothetical protein
MKLQKLPLATFAPLLIAALAPHGCATAEPIADGTLQGRSTSSSAASSAAPAQTTSNPQPSATQVVPGTTSSPSATAEPTDTASGEPSASAPPADSATTAPTAAPTASETEPPPSDTSAGGGPPVEPTTPVEGDAGSWCERPATTLPAVVIENTKVEINYITYDQNPNAQVQFQIMLMNTASMNVAMNDLTARYWLTIEEGVIYNIRLQNLGNLVMDAEIAVKETSDGRQYIEVDYPAGDLMLGGNGQNVRVDLRLETMGNVQFDNTNDWSWDPQAQTQTAWVNDKITVYRSGNLVFGEEPPCLPKPSEIPDAGAVEAGVDGGGAGGTSGLDASL